MYLKALEIQGFKSFPEKTRLTFDRDITAIVGPNGSGKSNIADALLWVMGEQRTKALRGGKMEDVIFGGTALRHAMGFAQVSLVLDNTGRIFSVDRDEVMLTRRYYRSGESEYYINKQVVRLKDIMDLLSDTGLGRDGYSVIGQGRIAEVVSAKSTDRREIFEEAAGIARYRRRKEEAERKLERTDENLQRVSDKIDELELQVAPLREQAETAKRYLLLRDELRALEISLWMETLDRLRDQSAAVSAEHALAQAALEQAHKDVDDMYAASENLSARMREEDVEAERLRARLGETEGDAAACESAAAVLRANLENHFENTERLRQELSEQEGRAKGLEEQMAERRGRMEAIDGERGALDLRMGELQRQSETNAAGMDETQRALADLLEREAGLGDAQAENRTTLAMLADAMQELYDREASCAGELQAAQERRLAAAARLDEDTAALQKVQEKVTELQNIIGGRRMLLTGRESKVAELREKQTRLTVDLRAMDGRIALLAELEKDYEGFNKAVKTVMREAGRGRLRGVCGPVAKLVQTGDRYTLAIETALGAAMQNIVVETPEQGKAAIELLKARDGGRATFLPLSSIRGASLNRVPAGEPGFLGVASELVQCDGRYGEVVKNLLGRTVIVETLGDAVHMAKKYDNSFRIVSLDGQIMSVGGAMTGGSAGRNTGILSRANELQRLGGQRVELAAAAEKAAAALSEAEREMGKLRYEMEVAQTELDAAQEVLRRCESDAAQGRQLVASLDEVREALETERASLQAHLADNEARIKRTRVDAERLEGELSALRETRGEHAKGREGIEAEGLRLGEERSALRARMASLEAERLAARQAVEQFAALREELGGDSETRQSAMAALAESIQGTQEELRAREERLAALRARIAEQKERIAASSAQRLALEGKRTAADKAAQEKNRELLDLERECARLEQKRISAEMEEKQIIDKLWDSYELSRSAAQALRQPLESTAQANRRAGELRRDITALGTPNLGAIEEYERVSARYDFLAEQRDDVTKARDELLRIIADITREMEEIFVREFKEIDRHFRETFLELFGGGRAALQLEDESDVLGCGIEIKIQPPGKALSTISLLSGGEKAFVAIALYFAIMKVRPTPFCVMDEIESALDEANVQRFSDYMRAMSARTQFLVITHRRGTMEGADMLYGVTMQEKGVSSILSVDMSEAMRTIRVK